MKLFHMPGACSTGILLLLEELGADYELQLIDLATGQQFSPEFRAINPKGKVPALLRDDGTLITEFRAIAFWLAHNNPEAGLLPRDLEGQCRTMELIDYIVGTVHMRGYTLARLPQKFTTDEQGQSDLRTTGLKTYAEGLARMSENLGEKPYFLGAFSIADAAAFYAANWAGLLEVKLACQPDGLRRQDARAARRSTGAPSGEDAFHRELTHAWSWGFCIHAMYRRIIVPIALRAYGNEIILMIKAASLASTIPLLEITGLAHQLVAESFRAVNRRAKLCTLQYDSDGSLLDSWVTRIVTE